MAPWDLFVCQWQVTLQFQVAAAVLMVRSHLNLEWTCQGRLSGDQSEHRHFRPVEQAEAAGVVAQSPDDHQGCPLDLVDAGVIPGEEAPAGVSQTAHQRQADQPPVAVAGENQVCTQGPPNLGLCVPVVKENGKPVLRI